MARGAGGSGESHPGIKYTPGPLRIGGGSKVSCPDATGSAPRLPSPSLALGQPSGRGGSLQLCRMTWSRQNQRRRGWSPNLLADSVFRVLVYATARGVRLFRVYEVHTLIRLPEALIK